MKISDLSADAVVKLREDGIETDQDILDSAPDELMELELDEDDLAKCLLIRQTMASAFKRDNPDGDKDASDVAPSERTNPNAEVPDDDREEFTVRLLPRHAQWVHDVVKVGQGNDESHVIEQCVRAAMVNDPYRAGRRGGGTVKAEDFNDD